MFFPHSGTKVFHAPISTVAGVICDKGMSFRVWPERITGTINSKGKEIRPVLNDFSTLIYTLKYSSKERIFYGYFKVKKSTSLEIKIQKVSLGFCFLSG